MRAFDGGFVVFRQPAAAPEPGKGALDDPSAGLELEAFGAGRALDDLDRPGAKVGQGAEQLRAAIHTVGQDVAQRWVGAGERTQKRHGPVVVLHVGGVDEALQQEALAVGDDVALASLDALGRVELAGSSPRGPPLSVVRTPWESITPIEGAGSRPWASRARLTRSALSLGRKPSQRHWLK